MTQVNEKFEQLMHVLEQAEATSGLEPPPPEEGQQVGACVNGRRVEVLSRTIWVLKKLLRDRRAANEPSSSSEQLREDEDAVVPTEALPPSTVTNFLPAHDIANMALPAPDTVAVGPSMASPPASDTPSGAALHMAMPVHGHPAMTMPPGFTMPAGMPAGMANMHNIPGQPQPFFFAVPMYMGQGMGSSSSLAACSSEGTTTPDGQGVPVPPSAAVEAGTAAAAAATGAPPAEAKPGMPSGVCKEPWAMPAGVGFPPMMLQMPNFVTQALSAEKGDEKPTHAVCA